MDDGQPSYELLIIEGAETGRRIVLRGGENLVGRGVGKGHVLLQSNAVSRRHAVLFVEEGAVVARDLASRNGTLVNGGRLLGTRPLTVGDTLEVGDVVLQLRMRDLPAPAAADPGPRRAERPDMVETGENLAPIPADGPRPAELPEPAAPAEVPVPAEEPVGAATARDPDDPPSLTAPLVDLHRADGGAGRFGRFRSRRLLGRRREADVSGGTPPE